MADWTDLPNSAVGVGGIPTGTTVTALRDNPVAIAEGATSAPRIKDAATELKYVRRGGGSFMDNNVINIGFDGPAGKVRVQVDATPLGFLVTNVDLAGALAGSVGSYALLHDAVTQAAFQNATVTKAPGTVTAGADLRYAGLFPDAQYGPTPTGSWRLMGFFSATNNANNPPSRESGGYTSLYLRIA